MQVIEKCHLEWDQKRGVLYVHSDELGCSVLRICGLSKEVRKVGKLGFGHMIDITLLPDKPASVSYPYAEEKPFDGTKRAAAAPAVSVDPEEAAKCLRDAATSFKSQLRFNRKKK